MSKEMSPSSQTPESASHFKLILEAALGEYKLKTGNDLTNNSLAKEIQDCKSVEAVLDIIQREAKAFDKFRDGDKGLMKWIGPSVDVLYTISATLGQGVGMVRIMKRFATIGVSVYLTSLQVLPAANVVSAGIGVLLVVRSSYFSCSALTKALMVMSCRQQRMSRRATMCSSTSSSAFSSSSSALGFILGFHRPRVWQRYS